MPQLTIRLRCDPQTGKKDIIISLRGDEDSLPHEHEQQHKALVEKLIEGGLLKAGEAGKIVVERGEEEQQALPPVTTPPVDQRRAQAQGD
jgi:FtsH ternary system domain X3-analog